MTQARQAAIEDRKALLRAHAELDRAKVTLAVFELKSIVAPARPEERMARLRPTASTILRFAAPVVGSSRLLRILRFASIALTVLRVVRRW